MTRPEASGEPIVIEVSSASHPGSRGANACHDPRSARVRLAILIASIALGISVALSPDPRPRFIPPSSATNDLDLFRSVVERVRAGESFHDASQKELRAQGYPTRSVFNWRSPIYAWWLGSAAGHFLGPWPLWAGALLVIGLSAGRMIEEFGLAGAGLGILSLVGALAWCLGSNAFLLTELWAGMFLALSVCCYQRGWPMPAVLTGLAALFFRELALPYCVIGLALAIMTRRKAEVWAWLAGLAAYLAFMLWHAGEVHSRLTELDLPPFEGGWVKLGGLRFVLDTAQGNLWLMGQSLWVTAIYLPLAVLGLSQARSEVGQRLGLTVVAYLGAFSLVGNVFNFYWGFMTAPLLALGIAAAPSALVELSACAFRKKASIP